MAKKLVWMYKFERARAAHATIATQINQTVPYLSPDTIITFVTTATSRLRTRGYDPAELIARKIAQERGLPCVCLATRINQARQYGASKKQREQQLVDAFIVVKPEQCKGKNLVIIDDVLTTGSTVEVVARVLRTAGAKHVDAAVFAQKI